MPFLIANFQVRFTQKEKEGVFMKEIQSAGGKKQRQINEFRRIAEMPRKV